MVSVNIEEAPEETTSAPSSSVEDTPKKGSSCQVGCDRELTLLADMSTGRLVKALFNYDSNNGFKFSAGDTMTVVAVIDSNWWKVAHLDNPASEGLAPVNYIKEEVSTKLVRAAYAYDSKKGFSFGPGDMLEVVQEVDSNWWRVKKAGGGPEGLAPINYLKVDGTSDA